MSFQCGDKSLLIEYLYGECGSAERQSFEEHLASCQSCADELAALGGVRQALTEWTPPEPALGFRIVRDEAPRRRWWQWPAVPVWAQAMAAVLLLAVGAAIANLDVQVRDGALTIRTGWSRSAAAPQSVTLTQPAGRAPTAAAARGDGPAPWRADLGALEQQLRSEFSLAASAPGMTGASAAVPRGTDSDVLRRVQALIGDSERRQQQAFEALLATRLVQLARDFDTQRRADWVRVQQGLGQVEGRTTTEVAQQRAMINALLKNVNIQEIK